MRTKAGPIILRDATTKAGHELLDHECWVMGKDVLSSEGNLLCEFGFRQVRCPNGGMTQYELNNALGEAMHVYLWGFGAFFGGEKEGIFLGRRDFKPSRTFGRVELHTKEYPSFGEETSRSELLLQGLAWFIDYEQWIAQRMPNGYRELCLASFPRRVLTGGELPHRWRDLIRSIEADQRASDRLPANQESATDHALPFPRSSLMQLPANSGRP